MSEMTQQRTRRANKKKVAETPVQETPVQETPVQETPVQETPVQETPVQETPVQEVVINAAMDERLNAAIAASNYRITLNNQRQNARLALQKGLTYSINGGVFNIDAALISMVQALLSMGKETTILLDVNLNPVEIENLEDFRDTIVDVYYEKMNEFLVEFKSISRSRTPKSLVGE